MKEDEHKKKWLKVEGRRKVYVNIEIEAEKENKCMEEGMEKNKKETRD